MHNYPINLKSQYIHALVIGAGSVGIRKIETLLKCGVSKITVIDKAIQTADFTYKDNPFVDFHSRAFSFDDLDSHNLVFISTENKELNSSIAIECNNRRILCNVITNPNDGTFNLPALIQKDEIQLTVSTSGASPALSRALKEDIENFIDSGYSDLCAFLGKLRPQILALNLPTKTNKEIFSFFVNSPQKESVLNFFKTKEQVLIPTILQLFDAFFAQEKIESKNDIKAIIQRLLAE